MIKEDNTINTFLRECYVRDLAKPSVDKFARAAIIREYITGAGISTREFGRRFNIPKSTVEDWLLYNHITEEEYAALLAKDLRPIDIYRGLRENRNKTVLPEIDVVLQEVKSKITNLRIKVVEESPSTRKLIHEAIDALNALEAQLNIQNKKKNKVLR